MVLWRGPSHRNYLTVAAWWRSVWVPLGPLYKNTNLGHQYSTLMTSSSHGHTVLRIRFQHVNFRAHSFRTSHRYRLFSSCHESAIKLLSVWNVLVISNLPMIHIVYGRMCVDYMRTVANIYKEVENLQNLVSSWFWNQSTLSTKGHLECYGSSIEKVCYFLPWFSF